MSGVYLATIVWCVIGFVIAGYVGYFFCVREGGRTRSSLVFGGLGCV